MSQFLQIHPDNPQQRLIAQAVQIVRQGGVIAYPTDSGYALGCHLGDKKAIEKIKWLRSLDDKHNFTLVCSDLSDIGTYAKVDNSVFRLLKANTPGPIPSSSMPPRKCRACCCTPSGAPSACACPIIASPMRCLRRWASR